LNPVRRYENWRRSPPGDATWNDALALLEHFGFEDAGRRGTHGHLYRHPELALEPYGFLTISRHTTSGANRITQNSIRDICNAIAALNAVRQERDAQGNGNEQEGN
jgi:predicted RNA binding protein YcfA (HicA-like mRNA interferase family)